jgi:hypothetical protein
MAVDSITDEIRTTRRALASKLGNDLAAILADIRHRERDDGRTYVSLPPRLVRARTDEQTHALERANGLVSNEKSTPHAQ